MTTYEYLGLDLRPVPFVCASISFLDAPKKPFNEELGVK